METSSKLFLALEKLSVMYFAQTNIRNQFELYLSFLSEIVNQDNKNYKDFFVGILKDTKGLSNGSLSYADISTEHFDLISLLASNHEDFFKAIDPSNVTKDNFEQILSFLKADMDLLVY